MKNFDVCKEMLKERTFKLDELIARRSCIGGGGGLITWGGL